MALRCQASLSFRWLAESALVRPAKIGWEFPKASLGAQSLSGLQRLGHTVIMLAEERYPKHEEWRQQPEAEPQAQQAQLAQQAPARIFLHCLQQILVARSDISHLASIGQLYALCTSCCHFYVGICLCLPWLPKISRNLAWQKRHVPPAKTQSPQFCSPSTSSGMIKWFGYAHASCSH